MRRPSDKTKIKKGRGKGEFENYLPWIFPYELAGTGRGHKKRGWLADRLYSLLSDLELYFLINIEWEDDTIIDIREQYPLPIKDTLVIAKNFGYNHPSKDRKENNVMSTDVFVIKEIGGTYKCFAYAVKPLEELKDKRVKEKLAIEAKYWEELGVPWSIITEENINIEQARNLWSMYNSYFWADDNNYSQDDIQNLYILFSKCWAENNDLLGTIRDFEQRLDWICGEGINFFKHLIMTKRVICNLNTPILSFTKIPFEFKE